MATIITREVGATAKGSPLSNAEVDQNFINLNTSKVDQTDIGTGPNEVPLNQFLGELAYMDAQNIPTLGINVANAATANVTNLMQVTEISNAVPSLNLDFAKVKQLDPRITFTRASTGTYYDGKTVAKAEENLILYSQDFDNAAWGKLNSTVVANAITAPDGTLTVDRLIENSATSTHHISANVTVTNATVYTASAYVKAAERNFVGLYAGSPGQGTVFNLTTGAVHGALVGAPLSSSITAVGNNWYRISITYTSVSTATVPSIYLCDNTGAFSYTGDGTSGIFIWGAQLEQRASATAYTPTTTQPVTTYIPVLLTAASGVPRFEHNPVTGESLGLGIEEQRTNLVTYSEQFNNAAWTKTNTTINADTIIAPDGTLTGDKIIESTTNGLHFVRQNISVSATSYTISFFAKAAERSIVLATMDGGSNSGWFNLSAGTTGLSGNGSATITAVGNAWYRCSFTATLSAGTAPCFIFVSTTISNASYAGDGYSGVYIWGAQLEAGAFPTSYIPTVASQVTRAADSAVMTGANFSSWYRQAEGTVFIENNYNFGSAANSGSRLALQLDNGSSNDRFVLSNGGQANSFVAQVGSVLQAYYDGAPHTANFVKTAFGYATNNMAVSNSGSIPSTDTSCLVPIVNTMRIGMFSNGALQLNGTIRKITYYPQRLSNAELVEMTA